MRWLMGGLLGLLLLLQYRLWFAEGGLAEANRLASQLEEAEAENATLSDRNATLTRELMALQSGNEAVEKNCLLYTSPSPRDLSTSRMPSSA